MSIQQLFFAGGKLNEATGGTITYDGDFQIHTFTSNGTFTVTRADVPSTSVSILVVGGGQSGRDASNTTYNRTGGANGGSGGQVQSSTIAISSFTVNSGYAVTVAPSSSAGAGFTSRLSGTGIDILSFGGNYPVSGLDPGFGGLDAAGTNGNTGTTSSISGTSQVYGSSGGGGGSGSAVFFPSSPYAGGTGGTNGGNGGAGGIYNQNGQNGTAGNYYGAGGGGGGGAGEGSTLFGGFGGDGYQGVVIIRFKYKNL